MVPNEAVFKSSKLQDRSAAHVDVVLCLWDSNKHKASDRNKSSLSLLI